jgi:repressor LexA
MPKPKRNNLNGPFNAEIQAVMDARGWKKLEEFADHFGIGRTTTYNLVQGRQTSGGDWIKPSLDTVLRLAMALQTPVDELLERLYPDIELPKPASVVGVQGAVAVQIAGVVGAGPGQTQLVENGTMYVPAKIAKGKDLAGYNVFGDSMCGGKRPICSGDSVAVNRLDKGRSGQAVVARLSDDSYVCKALKEDKFGRRLMSTNALYTNSAPPIITAEMVAEIIGVVVWKQGAMPDLEES